MIFARKVATPLIVVALVVAAMVFLSPTATAVDFLPDDVCEGAGADSAACNTGGADPIIGNEGVIQRAANLIAIAGGIAAVVGIIIGGFMYIIAAGDSGKVGSAKKIIIYSLVGLVIIGLARTIIVFVVSRV